MRALPSISGTIDRRILLNVSIDPEVMAARLPEPFRPKTVAGRAMAGICLIRMVGMRPGRRVADRRHGYGLGSENAAHRVAVTWPDADADADREPASGVYVPRRDTSSGLAALAGGRLFPGRLHRSRFEVRETDECFHVSVASDDGGGDLRVVACRTEVWPSSSVFPDLEAASEFYRGGSLGYSATGSTHRHQGLELETRTWHVEPLAIELFSSNFFAEFPAGSVAADHALLMTDIDCAWRARPDLTAA